jgi:hypothetical protein
MSWYNGWPKRLYAFQYLHGIQELNFPCSEFLYAWIPTSGLLPFPFAKISAALGAWGVIVESVSVLTVASPTFYRVHFRSLLHMINCIFSYVEYATDDSGRLLYTDDTKSARIIEQCYGIPLIFRH